MNELERYFARPKSFWRLFAAYVLKSVAAVEFFACLVVGIVAITNRWGQNAGILAYLSACCVALSALFAWLESR